MSSEIKYIGIHDNYDKQVPIRAGVADPIEFRCLLIQSLVNVHVQVSYASQQPYMTGPSLGAAQLSYKVRAQGRGQVAGRSLLFL
jgi:hypothetical protein